MIAQDLHGWGPGQAERLDALLGEVRSILEGAPAGIRRRYELPHSQAASAVAVAKTLYGQRRARRNVFADHASIFSEPAWDLLLDLFIAHGEGRQVSVTSACIGACAPASTVLRCIDKLAARGLVRDHPHPQDGRVRLVGLTEPGVDLLGRYLLEFV